MLYYAIIILTLIALNAILVMGLNIQFGYAGVLNFGYVTFVAVGAYVTAVSTLGKGNSNFVQQYILHWSLPWPLPLILAGLVSAALGALMAVVALRRLRSDYLAIATISMSQVIWTVIGNDTPLFNGWQGLAGVPQPFAIPLQNASQVTTSIVFLIISVVMAVLVYIGSRLLYRSPLGRLMRSVREDDVVTETFGHSAFKIKFIAFVIGCFVAGVGGGLLVEYQSAYSTNAWLPIETFIIWAALIIGGTGNNLGAIVGSAVVLVGINEATRFLPSFIDPSILQPIRGILIGALMLVVLKFMPAGLISERRIKLYKTKGSSIPAVIHDTRQSEGGM